MTEYELAELMGSVSGDSLVFIPIYLTVISAYLVVAWLVGSKLTQSQVILVNSLFIGAALVFLSAWNVRIEVAYSYQKELLAINPVRHPIVNPWLQPSVYVMSLVTITACLKFMWDIRHPKAE